MSNYRAIAACTMTLRRLLEDSLKVDVTTLPLDKATPDGEVRRVNLFLYHTLTNGAWRNMPIPERARPGERATPPLPLNLYYLLTAYGDHEETEDDHQLLGQAMLTFHSNPFLSSLQIQSAIPPSLTSAVDLDKQVERIKITYEPLSLDELMKLWGTFHQSPYRISAAFQASVILLESDRPTRSPLPMFFRGEDDRGANVHTGVAPILEAIEYRDPRENQVALPAAQIGDVIALTGSNLPVDEARVAIYDPKVRPTEAEPEKHLVARLNPQPGSSNTRLLVELNENANFVSGRLAIVVEYGPAERVRRSNHLRLYLAPRLVDEDEGDVSAITTFEGGRRKLIVNCKPPPGTGRDVQLLLTSTTNGHAPPPIALAPPKPLAPDLGLDFGPALAVDGRLSFDVDDVAPGAYRVRLRVDLVDSLPIRRVGSDLVLDERQEVQI